MDLFRLTMCMFPEEIINSFKTYSNPELQDIIFSFISMDKFRLETCELDQKQQKETTRLNAIRLMSYDFDRFDLQEEQMSLYGAFLDLAHVMRAEVQERLSKLIVQTSINGVNCWYGIPL